MFRAVPVDSIRTPEIAADADRPISAFSLGLNVVIVNLITGGHGYQQVVPVPYGLLSLVPAAVGLVAVVRVWRLGLAMVGRRISRD